MRLVLLLALVLAGCTLLSDTETGLTDVRLLTDQSSYAARQEVEGPRPRYGFDLVARFQNRTSRTLYLDRCQPDISHPTYSLELVEPKDEYGAAYSAAWACVGGVRPIEVAAGQTRTDTLHISGPNAWPNGSTRHLGEMEGRFRLHYDVSTCRSETECRVADSLAWSEPFDVTVAASEEGVRKARDLLAGSWQWYGSRGDIAGRNLWPGADGNPPRVVEFDDDGSFRVFQADTLASSGTFVLERSGIDHVLRYSTDAGTPFETQIDQYVSFDGKDKLILDDAYSCADCYMHRYIRMEP